MDNRITLLENDFIILDDPNKKGVTHKLYRIYANEDIKIGTRIIPKDSIGGRISKDVEIYGSWVDNFAIAFGKVFIENSILSDRSRVFGNSKVISSLISDMAWIKDNSVVKFSIVSGKSEIFENAQVSNSFISNSSRIHGNCIINSSSISGGATVSGQAKCENSKLSDTSSLMGNVTIFRCSMAGRAVLGNVSRKRGEIWKEVEPKLYQNTSFFEESQIGIIDPIRNYSEEGLDNFKVRR